MRAEDPRPEPDIEWPALAADGRSLVAWSYRDIANAILADQSGADRGEAAQGHQPTWLLPRAVRERMGTLLRCGRHTVTTKQCRTHRQPLSRHSFAGCDGWQASGCHSPAIPGARTRLAVAELRRETASKIVGLRRALVVRLRLWVFRPHIGLLPLRYIAAGDVRGGSAQF